MDIQQLQTFVEVVRQGSFAGAARRLDMSASMVTRQVAALEAALRARLLNRTTRQLSLTQAGQAYVERVEPLLAELQQAGDDAAASSGALRGKVRLTASVAYGQTALVPLLPQLHTRHPGLQLELLLSDAVVDLVAQQVDVALRLGPALDSSLIGTRLRRVRYRVCASPAYLKAHGRPRAPADLAACDCLRFALPGYRAQWFFRAADDPAAVVETVPVGGWLVASTALALHRAALDGMGPVMLADWLVDADIAAGRLVDLFPALEASATHFDSGVWLLYPARAHLPQRVRAVVDFLKDKLSAGPGCVGGAGAGAVSARPAPRAPSARPRPAAG